MADCAVALAVNLRGEYLIIAELRPKPIGLM